MNIMVDIETLGTNEDSVILQIGAVAFDVYNEKEAEPFEGWFLTDLLVSDQIRTYKRTVDNETLIWWMDSVGPKARTSVLERDGFNGLVCSTYNALEDFNTFVSMHKDEIGTSNTGNFIWSNSPSFDLAIIKNAMRQCDIKPVWNHWDERDVRTMDHLNKTLKLGLNKKIEGVAHNALDDAKGQAIYVMQITDKLQQIKSKWADDGLNAYTYNTPNTHSLFPTY
jgi:hypothetical protein